MPDSEATPDTIPVLLVIQSESIPRTDDDTRRLEEILAGLGAIEINHDRLELFGIITCAVPPDQLDALRELPEIESAEPDETMHLQTPDTDNEDGSATP